MKLGNLAGDILAINESLQNSAAKSIYQHVTARNWLIGYCIVNFEKHGEDCAQYGERVLQTLAEKLNTDGLSYRNLILYRQFYIAYPELYTSVAQFLLSEKQIWQPVDVKSQLIDLEGFGIRQPAVAIDESIFISTYMLHLPNKDELMEWIKRSK